jgi:hypothetical protein
MLRRQHWKTERFARFDVRRGDQPREVAAAADMAARSVTEIAPRASSRLNVCAALRIIS